MFHLTLDQRDGAANPAVSHRRRDLSAVSCAETLPDDPLPMADTVPFSSVRPAMTLDLLSQREMASLANSDEAVYRLFRRCALAVLNTGSDSDDTEQILREYRDFDVRVIAEPRGVRLELVNAPAGAFVDGEMLFGIRHHLFSALRDIIYVQHELLEGGKVELDSSEGITDAVFRILRHAEVVRSSMREKAVENSSSTRISQISVDHRGDALISHPSQRCSRAAESPFSTFSWKTDASG